MYPNAYMDLGGALILLIKPYNLSYKFPWSERKSAHIQQLVSQGITQWNLLSSLPWAFDGHWFLNSSRLVEKSICDSLWTDKHSSLEGVGKHYHPTQDDQVGVESPKQRQPNRKKKFKQ